MPQVTGLIDVGLKNGARLTYVLLLGVVLVAVVVLVVFVVLVGKKGVELTRRLGVGLMKTGREKVGLMGRPGGG